MEPTFDIQTPSTQQPKIHRSHRFVGISSLVLVVLAVVYIALQVKEKRAHDAYLRTPEGQLEALEATSEPVITSPEDRYKELTELQRTSGPSASMTYEERINALKALE